MGISCKDSILLSNVIYNLVNRVYSIQGGRRGALLLQPWRTEAPSCNATHLSTKIPACTACTMLRNFGFSSERRAGRRTLWVKVDANQSVTSEGTPSDCSCWRSSSDSRHCLGVGKKKWRKKKWDDSIPRGRRFLPVARGAQGFTFHVFADDVSPQLRERCKKT